MSEHREKKSLFSATMKSPRGAIKSISKHIPLKHTKSDTMAQLSTIPAEVENEVPFYTCGCTYEGKLDGFLHLYSSKVLFHATEQGIEVLSISLALDCLDTLKKTHSCIIIGTGKARYHFYDVEKRKKVIQLIKGAMQSKRRLSRVNSNLLMVNGTDSNGSEEIENYDLTPESLYLFLYGNYQID